MSEDAVTSTTKSPVKMEEAAAPSTSTEQTEEVDLGAEAKKLLGVGHRHLVMKDVQSAVNAFQEASSLLAKKHGETADECGEAFFSYGISLLELARMENGVLGNALEGMPEDEEAGEKEEDPNIPSATNLDEKEREQLREQVYDAMAEDEVKATNGSTKTEEKEDVGAKEETGKNDVDMEECNKNEEKANAETPDKTEEDDKKTEHEESMAEKTEVEKDDMLEKTTEAKDDTLEKMEEKDDTLEETTEAKDKLEKTTEAKDKLEKTTEAKDKLETAEAAKDELETAEAAKDKLETTTEAKDDKLEKTTEAKDKLEKTTEAKDKLETTTEAKDDKLEKTTEAKDKLEKTTEAKDKLEKTTEAKDKLEMAEAAKDKLEMAEAAKDKLEMAEAAKDDKLEKTTEDKDKLETMEEKDDKTETMEEKDDKTEKMEEEKLEKAEVEDKLEKMEEKLEKTNTAAAQKDIKVAEDVETSKADPALVECEEKLKEDEAEDQEQMECDEEEGDGAESEENDTVEHDATEEKEDEEEVGNLQLAWEMLDLSKIIFLRQKTKDAQLKAAQAHLKLGEVSVESENYNQAVEDFMSCLNIQKEHLEEHDRLLAETHYQLGLAYQYSSKHEEAISHFTQSVQVIEKRMVVLTDNLKKAEEEPAVELQKEMDELKGLLPDIKEKIDDSKEAQRTAKLTEIALKETLAGSSGFSQENGSTSAFASSLEKSKDAAIPATNCISDISHLVRKKRKPEEESPLKDNEAKKSKQELVENGAGNGDAVVPNNEDVEKAEEAEQQTPMETAAVESTA